MRSLLALVVPALLSLNLVACASEEANADPNHDVVQNPLSKDGDNCSQNSDCASNRCVIAEDANGTTRIKGMPAPCTGDNCGINPDGEPIDTDPSDEDPVSDKDTSKGKDTSKDTKGKPIEPNPGPQPTPQPQPTPANGVCIARIG